MKYLRDSFFVWESGTPPSSQCSFKRTLTHTLRCSQSKALERLAQIASPSLETPEAACRKADHWGPGHCFLGPNAQQREGKDRRRRSRSAGTDRFLDHSLADADPFRGDGGVITIRGHDHIYRSSSPLSSLGRI